ncbi:MAG: nuclear transport factor 2 family protein [Candidatus Nanopelagicales bacterium]
MDATALVDKFLQLNEDRDIEAAQAMMAPGCRIEFPGKREFASLADMVANAKGRYNWVRKHRDRYFVGSNGNQTVVTSIGTLYGENLSGVAFEGIRYVDVFVIEDGLIVEQMVWNDFGETGVLN